MPNYNDLPEFLSFLESKGLLLRITEEVSTYLELTEISRRILNAKGPALLFENVINHHTNTKSAYSVLTNLFGTVERVALGLGVKESGLKELGQHLAYLRNPQPPKSMREAWDMLPLAKQVMAMSPKVVKKAACQEVVETDIDIHKLPIQFCWPEDVSPLITWPIVITRGSSDKGERYNLGIYRMQPIAPNKLIMRWLKLRGGAEHFKKWKNNNQSAFPVAIAIGADPGTILSAVMPLPDNLSEYNFAGLLRNKSVELVKCVTNDLLVPANAEFVIEGEINLDEYADEGPFGDHTGYYNEVDRFPVVTIKAITHKRNPIYLTTYTGRPPDEPSVLGEALNDVFVPLLQQQFPEIVDFWLPPEGCSYRIAIVSIRKTYAGQGRKIMMGIWSFLRQFIYTKYIIVVDDDINTRDWKDVMWAVSTRSDPVRDIMQVENTPIDYLDFASPLSGMGGKMGIDATNKIPPETAREWGRRIEMTDDTVRKVDEMMQRIIAPVRGV